MENNGWTKYKLGEVCEIVGGATPSTKIALNWDGDIPWLTPKDLSAHIGRFIAKGERNITKLGYNSCSTKMLPKGSVLFSSRAPIGYVAIAENEMCTNQGFKSVIPGNKVYNLFLYYLLVYNKTKIENMGSGTTFKEVSGSVMQKIEISLPPLITQRKIASILSAIDDKIELNDRMNENLINLIHEDVLENLPYDSNDCINGWKTTSLLEIADFYNGYSYKGKELIDNQDCAMVTIKNFGRGGGFKLDGFKEIKPSDRLKPTQTVEIFDTIVAHTDLTQKAEVAGNGEIILTDGGYKKLIMSMDLVKVIPKKGYSKFLIAGILSDKRFKSHALKYVNGSTVLHMSKLALPEYNLLLPDDKMVLEELSARLETNYRLVSKNIEENKRLAELRDSLLPKLMSGEIDVDSVEL